MLPSGNERDAFYREAFNNTGIGLSHFLPDGTILFMDQNALRIFEIEDRYPEPAMVFGKPIDELFSYPGLKEQLQAKLRNHSLEYPFIAASGKKKWILLDSDPVRDPKTCGEAIQAVIQDITERKQAENHLMKLNETLEQRIFESTKQLAAADAEKSSIQQAQIAALEQAGIFKDQFLSILSHELRTPLNSINGFGSILLDEVAGSLNEIQHEYLSKMLSGADKLLALVNDLLDMTRIQAGQFSIIPHAIDFPEVVGKVLEILNPLADQKHQCLLNAVPDDLPPVMADDLRIAQVLTNLINNAVKFTADGGTITVRAFIEGNHLLCQVDDDGIGIVQEDIPKLFRRFSQLDETQARQLGGSGLGLSISKAIIEAHKGEIGVESEWGKGSTFWFTLP